LQARREEHEIIMTSANTLKSVALLALLTALLLCIGRTVGGNGGMVLALVLALVMNFGSYWFSDKLALAMSHARAVSPEEAPALFRIIEEIASLSRMPMPRVYIVESPSPNAFATGRDPAHAAVAVTTGILGILDERELRGVLAHELAHVRNRDTLISTIVAPTAGAIGMIAHMAQWALMFGGFGRSDDRDDGGSVLGGLFAIIVAPIIAMLVQLAISRAREYEADATGANLVHDPLALARALQKLETATAYRPMTNANPATAHLFIVNPFGNMNIAQLLSTHPPLHERVQRLQRLAGLPS
jgi:heat shock protein HtpX